MIMLRQNPSDSPGGENASESLLPKSSSSSSSPSPQVQVHVELVVSGERRERERQVITINNEEYEEMSVHTDDEEWEWQQELVEEELATEHELSHAHPHPPAHPSAHHHDKNMPQQSQPQPQAHQLFYPLQQMDSIEELLGSSIESLDGDHDDVDDDDRPTPLAWQRRELAMGMHNHNQTETLLIKLQDSPMTRRRKMMEADELVSEEEEDDIDSIDGSMYEELESPASSDDYDDITDAEEDDDDADAWSGEYVYEEIELPDHITPIQKNWFNSWFCSTHRRRMEQISEGEEEETNSDSEGSISLKDGKSSKGNDLDKSWGSLDSHMRSWHSQRSHRSFSPHYQVTSTPPLLRDIKALLPAKSPTRPSLPKARKPDQPPPEQAEKLVRSKEEVEEQELNDSLRLGDRTAFLKAKRKAAALKKQRKEKKDKGKRKDKKSTLATGEKQPRRTKSLLADPKSATSTPSALALPPPPPPPPPLDQPELSTRSDIDKRDSITNKTINNNDSKSRSRRKSTTLKIDSSTHEGSKSARTQEGVEIENSARSKSKSKRTSKTKSSSTDKEADKSDRSTSKSTRRLKAAMEETEPGDVENSSNRQRKIKDTSDPYNIPSPVKSKKRSKTKPTLSVDAADSNPDGSGLNSELPLPLDTLHEQEVNASNTARQDPIDDKEASGVDPENNTNHDANEKSRDQNVENFQKTDSKRSKRGRASLSRLQALPGIQSPIPGDCETASKADTIKTSEPKKPKSPKHRKSDAKLPALQNLVVPFDNADPSKPSSQRSQNSLNSPTDDSVNQEAEDASIATTTSKSPRTKAKVKISSGTIRTLEMDTTKKPSSRKSTTKSSTAKKNDSLSPIPPDDENSSIKSRSNSARSKSTGSSKSRRKSEDKSQSKHKTASTDDDSQQSSKPLSTTKRGGKRHSTINSLDAQRRSDPNLASGDDDDDDNSSDRLSLSPRKAKSMMDLGQLTVKSQPKSPAPSTNMTNSSWSKVESQRNSDSESEALFLQLDLTNDGKADAKQLSSTGPVRPSLLSQMSWNEKLSRGSDANVPLSLRNLKVTTGSTTTRGGSNPLEEPDTPSTSNRKAGFFRFLISPLKRAKSFSQADRPKSNIKEPLRRPSLLAPMLGHSRPKDSDKKSHSLHQVSSVTFTEEGTPSIRLSDTRMSDLSHANATSNDTVPGTVPVQNGTASDHGKPTDESVNSESGQPAPLSILKDDSAGTIKTSMMSLSLDEECTGTEANADPTVVAEESSPTPENGHGPSKKASFANVSGKIQVKPNSFRVSNTNWKSVLNDDHDGKAHRTST